MITEIGYDRIRQRGQAGRVLQEGRRDATVLSPHGRLADERCSLERHE
jgi:hypothetical protein